VFCPLGLVSFIPPSRTVSPCTGSPPAGREGCRGVGCRDRFHEAADFLRRAPLHIVGDVRIGVQREPGAEVAQHTGQGFYIHAAGDCHRGEGVSEVMIAHMLLDARIFQQLPVDP